MYKCMRGACVYTAAVWRRSPEGAHGQDRREEGSLCVRVRSGQAQQRWGVMHGWGTEGDGVCVGGRPAVQDGL
jgi:hypothetical protein